MIEKQKFFPPLRDGKITVREAGKLLERMEEQNQICKSLYEAIEVHPPRSGERRLAIRRYQKANAERTELKRAIRLAN